MLIGVKSRLQVNKLVYNVVSNVCIYMDTLLVYVDFYEHLQMARTILLKFKNTRVESYYVFPLKEKQGF